jgi:hypothetical protein
MQGETKERWQELCEQAAVEQDSEKLLALTTEINRLLLEKEERLKKMRARDSLSASVNSAA